MEDDTKVALAAALAGGYVLGRTKRGRLALTAVTFMLFRRLGLEPRQLVTEGVRRLSEVPQVAELQEQIKTEGVEAARQALSSVAERGLGSLTDVISGRVTGAGKEEESPEDAELTDEEEVDAQDAEADDEARDEDEDQEPDEDEEMEEEEGEDGAADEAAEPEVERPSRERVGAKHAPKRKASPSKKAAPGRGPRKPAAKKSPAKKATSGRKSAQSSRSAPSRSDGRRHK